jgi:hypothetical protein
MASSSHDISNDEGHAEVSEAELAQVRVSVSDTFERLAAAEQSTLHRFGHAAKILHSPSWESLSSIRTSGLKLGQGLTSGVDISPCCLYNLSTFLDPC